MKSSIIPRPQQIEMTDGCFSLNRETKIVVGKQSAACLEQAELLQQKLKEVTGLSLEVVSQSRSNTTGILLKLSRNLPGVPEPEEGYRGRGDILRGCSASDEGSSPEECRQYELKIYPHVRRAPRG